MSQAPYLVDKSALAQRHHHAGAKDLLLDLSFQGLLATCSIVALEVRYSARSLTEFDDLDRNLRAQRWLDVTSVVTERASAVQRLLAARGQHRLPIADLLVAATAEVHGAVVLHFDRDFDRIAAVTGQPTRWIVEPPAA